MDRSVALHVRCVVTPGALVRLGQYGPGHRRLVRRTDLGPVADGGPCGVGGSFKVSLEQLPSTLTIGTLFYIVFDYSFAICRLFVY